MKPELYTLVKYLLLSCLVCGAASCGPNFGKGYINQRNVDSDLDENFGQDANSAQDEDHENESDLESDDDSIFDPFDDINQPDLDNDSDNDLGEDQTLPAPPHKFNSESQYNMCTDNWVDASQLQIGINKPTDLSGDTFAAYGLFTLQRRDRNARLVFKVKGYAPDARFFSFETYYKYIQRKVDLLYDHHMFDSGQLEHPGAHAGKPYEFFLVDQDAQQIEGYKNVDLPEVQFTLGKQNISMFYRVYAPTDGRDIERKNLPKVYAYNADTGAAVECPAPYQTQSFILNQDHVDLFRGAEHKINYDFIPAPDWFERFGFGGNSAVPWYVLEFNKIFEDSVSVIRFKAPTYTGQYGVQNAEVRYWSICAQDIANNTTLSCLPDQFAKPDALGFVTVVFSRENFAIRSLAERLGASFMPDQRGPDQNTIGFNYRNVLPDSNFSSSSMYKGDYLPSAVTCTVADYLDDQLRAQNCSNQ